MIAVDHVGWGGDKGGGYLGIRYLLTTLGYSEPCFFFFFFLFAYKGLRYLT